MQVAMTLLGLLSFLRFLLCKLSQQSFDGSFYMLCFLVWPSSVVFKFLPQRTISHRSVFSSTSCAISSSTRIRLSYW